MVGTWSLSMVNCHFGQGSCYSGSFALPNEAVNKGGELQMMEVTMEEDLTTLLPDECLACIFHKLGASDRNSCALVCKRWLFVDAQTRDRLTIRAETPVEFPSLLSRFNQLTSISLRDSRKAASAFGIINDESLFLIGDRCDRLSRLKLKSCRAITDIGLSLFAKHSHRLKKFSCSSCGFGAPGLNAILQQCDKMEELSVKRLKQFIHDRIPLSVIDKGGKLRRLCLKSLANAPFLFGELLANSKQLQTLILSRNSGDWDEVIERVVENSPGLSELHLGGIRLTDRGLRAVAGCKEMEVLRVIKVSDCSSSGLRAAASGWRKLRKLHLDDRTGRICDDGLLAIANQCVDLQELVLIGVRATSASLGLIAANCRNLERIALCNSEAVGDAELSCLADRCLALRKLCIKNCPISDRGFESFADTCPNLSKVKVKKCSNVTWSTVVLLQMSHASLTVSLDSLNEAITTTEDELEMRAMASSTSVLCSGSYFFKNRMAVAAGSFLRCFCRSS